MNMGQLDSCVAMEWVFQLYSTYQDIKTDKEAKYRSPRSRFTL